MSSPSYLAFNKIHIVDSMCKFVFIFPGQINHSLYIDISYLSDLSSYGANCQSVSPYHETI